MDTAGQEVYKALVESYYKKADCCLLVYDITNKNSFLEIKNYYSKNIKEKCKPNIKVILLGNKTDLENREVSSKEGVDLSLEHNYTFMETSCLKNHNVADAFETLIEETNREAVNQQIANQQMANSNIQINNTQITSKSSSCFC